MDAAPRLPCLRCGEPAVASAEVCPHCRMPALVDVFASAGSDARQRYQAARAILALGIRGLSLTGVQSAFGLPGMPLARRLTRADARRVLDVLAKQGLTGEERPSPEASAGAAAVAVAERSSRSAVPATVLLALGVAALWFLWPGPPPPPPPTPVATPRPKPTPQALTTAQIAEAATRATVSIRCGDSLGSGFLFRPSLVLTNSHVCRGKANAEVTFWDGKKQVGFLADNDEDLDLAVVHFVSNFPQQPPLVVGDASGLEVGNAVVMIGSPRGLDFTVHEGRISSTFRNHLGVAYLQLDANVNPGNSGGPLLDNSGRVVGIVSMMVSGSSGLGFALPINYAYAKPSGDAPLNPAFAKADRWKKILEAVAEADRKEADALATAFRDRFGIIAARLDRRRDRLVAMLIRRGSIETSDRRVTLQVEQRGSTNCMYEAHAYGWGSWDQATARASADEDPRYLRWLKKNDLTRDLQIATVEVNLCSTFDKTRPSDVLLRPGDPQADRVRVAAYEGGG